MVLENERIVSSLNAIRDNIWLGDFDEVSRIAESIVKDDASRKFIDDAEKGRTLVHELRRMARKDKQIKDTKTWLAENVQKYFRKNEFSTLDYIMGTIVSRIEWIKVNIENIHKETKPPILLREGYKLRVIPKEPKYEVRALLFTRARLPDEKSFHELAKKLGTEGRSIERHRSSVIMRFFSNSGFIEAVVLPNVVEIDIVLQEPNQSKVIEISDSILSTVTVAGQT